MLESPKLNNMSIDDKRKSEVIVLNSDIPEELKAAKESIINNYATAKEVNRKAAIWGKYIKQKYGERRFECRLFCFLAGSSVVEGECGFRDFPGEDSIEKILREGKYPEFEFKGSDIVRLN